MGSGLGSLALGRLPWDLELGIWDFSPRLHRHHLTHQTRREKVALTAQRPPGQGLRLRGGPGAVRARDLSTEETVHRQSGDAPG